MDLEIEKTLHHGSAFLFLIIMFVPVNECLTEVADRGIVFRGDTVEQVQNTFGEPYLIRITVGEERAEDLREFLVIGELCFRIAFTGAEPVFRQTIYSADRFNENVGDGTSTELIL